jgi:hypothetical protein
MGTEEQPDGPGRAGLAKTEDLRSMYSLMDFHTTGRARICLQHEPHAGAAFEMLDF